MPQKIKKIFLISQYLEKYSHTVQQLRTRAGTHICIFESLQLESSHVKVFLHLKLCLRVCFWGTQPKTKTKGLVYENVLSMYRAYRACPPPHPQQHSLCWYLQVFPPLHPNSLVKELFGELSYPNTHMGS